jgi:hypothetical protein
MIERMQFDRPSRDHYLIDTRPSEQDVWPLHCTRVLCTLAGLLKRRKGGLRLTKLGLALLADARAGELYALLFHTCFRELNLSYYSPWGENWGELQFQIAFTLHALSNLADHWERPIDLMEKAVLPHALDQAPASRWAQPERLFEHRVLDVLVDLGLLERREEGSRTEPMSLFRRTPLYRQFITFA